MPEAILYYGFSIGNPEETDPWPFDEDFYEVANDTWRKSHRPKEPDDNNNERFDTPEWDDWREKLVDYEKTPENIEVSRSGYDDGTNYYVHCKCIQKSVEWDEQLTIGNTNQHPEADKWIKQFCEETGIPFQKPTWVLACNE